MTKASQRLCAWDQLCTMQMVQDSARPIAICILVIPVWQSSIPVRPDTSRCKIPIQEVGLPITAKRITFGSYVMKSVANLVNGTLTQIPKLCLRAYLKWGVQAFAKLRGMFALAIWDQLKGRLVLARDSFGVKPLYYFFGSDLPEDIRSSQCTAETDKVTQPIPTDRFVFASEVRALLASELIPRELSSPAVASFLEYGSVQAPFTIIKNVWSLMPGTSLIISGPLRGKLSISVSCFTSQPSNGRQPYDRSQAEAKVELRGILEDSVEAHLVSDVPVGVFLSGGMDSSALVGLMSRVSSDRPKTFSVVSMKPNLMKLNTLVRSRRNFALITTKLALAKIPCSTLFPTQLPR